jgi:hypothetical protein
MTHGLDWSQHARPACAALAQLSLGRAARGSRRTARGGASEARRGGTAPGDGSTPAHGTAGRRRLTGAESATGDGGRNEAAAAARPAVVRATRLGQRRSGRRLSGGGVTRSGNGRRERGCQGGVARSGKREACCRDARRGDG